MGAKSEAAAAAKAARKVKDNPQPQLLTPERQAKICQYLGHGAYLETAAAAVGVHYRTLRQWLRYGAEHEAAGADDIYTRFCAAVEEAQAKADLKDIALISAAAKDDWKAAAWRLARRRPQQWGEVKRHELSGPEGGPIETRAIEALDDEELDAELQRLRAIQAP